jgi:xylitol oxidase
VFTRWGDVPGELWCKQRDDEPASASFDLGSLRPADDPRHPIPGAATDACTAQLGRSGPWWNRLPHFRADAMPSSGDEIQAELFVDRTNSAPAIDALRSIGAQLDDVLLVSEIRTVRDDQLWMSAHHGRDSTGFHFTFRMDQEAVQSAVDAIGVAVRGFEPRFHPSKALPTGWRFDLPEQERFIELKQRLDPQDRFTTPWFRTHVRPEV